MNKLACFTDSQWNQYMQDVTMIKNNKTLDICFDCTVEYQVQMRKEGKCSFPMKRLDKIAEYA